MKLRYVVPLATFAVPTVVIRGFPFTVYFWADPVAHLREICRVLVDGGRLVLAFTR